MYPDEIIKSIMRKFGISEENYYK